MKVILGFIRSMTMVGLLPVPHAIVVRKYQPNTFTSLWFTAFLWGVVFLQNQGAHASSIGRRSSCSPCRWSGARCFGESGWSSTALDGVVRLSELAVRH